jgi:hypothetical protein
MPWPDLHVSAVLCSGNWLCTKDAALTTRTPGAASHNYLHLRRASTKTRESRLVVFAETCGRPARYFCACVVRPVPQCNVVVSSDCIAHVAISRSMFTCFNCNPCLPPSRIMSFRILQCTSPRPWGTSLNYPYSLCDTSSAGRGRSCAPVDV